MNIRFCTECQEPISDARITAKPNASLCRDCQEKKEQNAPAPYKPVAYFASHKEAMGYLYSNRGNDADAQMQGVMDNLRKSEEGDD